MQQACEQEIYSIAHSHLNHQQHQLQTLHPQQPVLEQQSSRTSDEFYQMQQLSSHSDHHQMISSNYNRELINSNSLSYNYEIHDDGWSSVNQSISATTQTSDQTDQSFKVKPDYAMNTPMVSLVVGQHDVNAQSCKHQQDAYQQHSSMSETIRIETNDFNNNQQTNLNQLGRRHNINSNQNQDCYRDQLFSNTTFYSNNSSTNYNQDTDQQYNLNGFDDQHHHHHNHHHHHHHHQLAMLDELPEIDHNQNKASTCYSQEASTSAHLQQYYGEQDPNQALDNQLYQPTALEEPAVQVVFRQDDTAVARQQQQQQQQQPLLGFEQATTSPDPYQAPRSAYTSLQQLTMNCDNYTNQVSTTTATLSTNEASQQVIKTRSLKNRRGRPRKKGLRSKNKVNGKLWEFIRDLLLNEHTNPSFIRWERREDGVFKFVQSDKVAKMWGERKQNPKMTYEKLSRAMRYYYKSKVLLPVFGRRLVYKFGPNATGWLPDSDGTIY